MHSSSSGKTFVENVKSLSQAKDVLRQNKVVWETHSHDSFCNTFRNQEKVPVAKFYKDSKSLVLLISPADAK